VDGDGPWTVPFPGANPSEAIARCAGELDEIDPRWIEALDFVRVPPGHGSEEMRADARPTQRADWASRREQTGNGSKPASPGAR